MPRCLRDDEPETGGLGDVILGLLMKVLSACPTRIILDRASSALDPVLRQIDSLTQPVGLTGTGAPSEPVRPDQEPSLSDMLSNIQALRRFCYRPRWLQEQREGGRRTVEESKSCCGVSSDCRSASGVCRLSAPPLGTSFRRVFLIR